MRLRMPGSAAMAMAMATLTAVAVASATVDAPPPAPRLSVDDLGPEFGRPELRIAAAPQQLALGERFTLFVTAVHRSDVTVNLPEPLTLGPALEIVRRNHRSKPDANGRITQEWQFETIAWAVGELALPPIELTFTFGGTANVVASASLPITVTGMLKGTDSPAARGLSPPVSISRVDWTWLVGGGAGFAVAGLLAVGWAVARKRRHLRRLPSVLDPIAEDSASSEAMQALDSLVTTGVVVADPRRAGIEMGSILRRYWGRRYQMPTQELTSSQLRASLTRRMGDNAGPALAWITQLDRVRYAGLAIDGNDAETMLGMARQLVARQ